LLYGYGARHFQMIGHRLCSYIVVCPRRKLMWEKSLEKKVLGIVGENEVDGVHVMEEV
jgi:hypothetical protein